MTDPADMMKKIAEVYGLRVADILRKDRTTKQNILWDAKGSRARGRAEVFTPAWVCNEQNNLIDAAWFGRPEVFNRSEGRSWRTRKEPVFFPEDKTRTWKTYVDARRLEITCGEAPYLASRYDVVTGEEIPLGERIGMLDRKLRIVGENTGSEGEWLRWARRAFESVYGYEYQGDSLFQARGNLLFSYAEYLERQLKRKPSRKELEEISAVISWNIWQMDGVTYTVPKGEDAPEKGNPEPVYCRILDWLSKVTLEYRSLAQKGNEKECKI